MPMMESPPGAETILDGRRYVYFGGTGYLGLQGHPEVIRAACRAAERYGIGSATSRSGFGNTPPVLDVERRAARLFRMDDAFYYMSGYVGAHILVLMLEDRFDALFVDEFSHYCVLEAARLSGRPVFRFRHRTAEDLEASLRANLGPGQRPLVMTDGVFAARGGIAPVDEYRKLLHRYDGSILIVDDAHGIGVLGRGGRGTLEHQAIFDSGVNSQTPAMEKRARGPTLYVCGTLSKAIGGYGGIVPGAGRLVDFVKNNSTYYAGASPPPVPVAAATAQAIELATGPGLRLRLRGNVRQVKDGLRRMGLEIDDTPVPIVCLTLGSADAMRRMEQALKDRGILVPYMAAYAGLSPEGALRLAVFATHTGPMIERLLDAMRGVL
jgi:7-keto-8-aminopelargonate synthetase-like enzyme